MTLQLPKGTTTGQPNCGVVAASVILGISYKEAYSHFSIGEHPSWRGRMTTDRLLKGIACLGQKKKKRLTQISKKRGGSLKSFVDWHTTPDKIYLVAITGHFVVVKNGYVADQSGIFHISVSKSRRTRVQSAFVFQVRKNKVRK